MKLISPCLYIVTKHPQQAAVCVSFVASIPYGVSLLMPVVLTQVFLAQFS